MVWVRQAAWHLHSCPTARYGTEVYANSEGRMQLDVGLWHWRCLIDTALLIFEKFVLAVMMRVRQMIFLLVNVGAW